MAIFDDFGGPQGGTKITKNRKMAFPKSIEKKDAKKEAMSPVVDEGRRPSRSPGNPRFRSGRLLQRLLRGLKHASTPGGVRRIYLATPVSADPPDSSYAADKPVLPVLPVQLFGPGPNNWTGQAGQAGHGTGRIGRTGNRLISSGRNQVILGVPAFYRNQTDWTDWTVHSHTPGDPTRGSAV